MIKLVAFYEDQWMPPGTDRAQWQHLAGGFGAEFQMVRSWSEAVVPDGHSVVVVDENGLKDSLTWEHPKDVVYVFGRSGQNLIREVPCDYSLKVDTPALISLFGISAASIVLRDRQSG